MSITSRKNECNGVNAHLHSILQNTPDGWEGFHLMHIGDLVRAVSVRLPAGYVVEPERSFQIRKYNRNTGEEVRPFKSKRNKKAEPDIAIYQNNPSLARRASPSFASMPTMTLEPETALDDPENYLAAFAIRVISNDQIGETVAWIELLSPTNKPMATGYDQYNQKRLSALAAGIVMVELDYLHESAPIVTSIPRYPYDSDSYPYYALVTDPRPTISQVHGYVYEFGVDQLMPVVRIPLLSNASVDLDLGTAYNHTFELFTHRVDYAQEPPRIEMYHAEAQQRIRARMAAVLATQQ